MLLLYILWDDWRIFIISGSNEQLKQQFEYTLQKSDCQNCWISKIQSWREERYVLKFFFKLGINATETYGMLQTDFGASCLNWASVFEWLKRFEEGRESVKDDERCGGSKELIGQIQNFMDKDGRVSIETISAQFDVSVWTLHTIICEELKMRKICAKFVPRGLRERFHYSREMVELINSDPSVLDALSDLRWKLDLLLWPSDQETEFPVEACWLSQTEQIHP